MKDNLTLLLLPGLDGTEVLFRPLLAALPAPIRTLVVCYPPDGPNDYESLLPLLRAKVAEHPGCFVLASSFSGPLAVMLAAAEPDRVRGLVLAATFLRAPIRWLLPLRFAIRGPLIGAVRTLRRIPVWTLRRREDPYRKAKAEIWRRVPARCLAARIRAILAADVRERFSRCKQPVLCLHFNGDTVVRRHNAEEILRGRPEAELVTLPGDHFAMWKAPGPLAAAVARFMLLAGGQDAARSGEVAVGPFTESHAVLSKCSTARESGG